MDNVRVDALKFFMFQRAIAVAFVVNTITIGVAVGETLPKRSDHLREPEPVEKVEHDVSTSVHHNIEKWKLIGNVAQRLQKVVRNYATPDQSYAGKRSEQYYAIYELDNAPCLPGFIQKPVDVEKYGAHFPK